MKETETLEEKESTIEIKKFLKGLITNNTIVDYKSRRCFLISCNSEEYFYLQQLIQKL